MPTIDEVTGVVLAGGASRRMGGIDKGLIHLGGRPMAAWVLDALGPQVGQLLISANRNRHRYHALGPAVISDALGGLQGPLAGIAAALAAATTPWILTAPCDAPQLPHDLCRRLAEALHAQRADLAIALDQHGRQTLHAMIPRSLGPHLDQYLNEGGRSVQGWLARLQVAEARFSDFRDGFSNANRPEELAELGRRLGLHMNGD